MLTIDDVAGLLLPRAGVTEGTRWRHRTWVLHGRAFAWERPLSKADIGRFGDDPVPPGPTLAVALADHVAKDALLDEQPPGFFTIAHFDRHPIVLVSLPAARDADVRDSLEHAMAACTTRTRRGSGAGSAPPDLPGDAEP